MVRLHLPDPYVVVCLIQCFFKHTKKIVLNTMLLHIHNQHHPGLGRRGRPRFDFGTVPRCDPGRNQRPHLYTVLTHTHAHIRLTQSIRSLAYGDISLVPARDIQVIAS